MMQSASAALRDANAPTDPPLLPFERAPIYLVRRLHQICTGALAEALDGALMPLEWAVLTHVHRKPGLDQKTLVESAGIDRSHTSRIIDELERKGLLQRKVNGRDRRAHALVVTQRGAAARARLRVRALASQELVLAPLTDAERETLFDLLNRLIAANARYARPGADRRKRHPTKSPHPKQRRQTS
jgi:DNA-binding MarR family transcriptional regulator